MLRVPHPIRTRQVTADGWTAKTLVWGALGLVVPTLMACTAEDAQGDQAETTAGTDPDSGATSSTDSGTGDGDSTPDGPAPAGPDHAPDPSTFGPYPVGVRTVELFDDSRTDDDGGPRPVTVEVWYPAVEDARGQPGLVYGIADMLRPEIAEGLPGLDVSLATDAVADAAVRMDGPFPLVLFSHGSAGIRMQSTYLTVALASHGYVVAAPDHYGNTLSDAIKDGGQSQEATLQAFTDRPIDMDVVLAWFEDLPADEPLFAATDTTRIGMAGHSFGALTAIRWMGMGAPLDAVVAQAPPPMDLAWLGVSTPLGELDTPLMLHVGGLDTTTPPADADSIWAEASSPRARLTLATGGHFTFSDMCTIPREALEAIAAAGIFSALDDGCSADNVDATAAFATLRHYAIGYFNVHLRDSAPTAALLSEAAGQALLGDEVTFEIDP